MVLAHSSAVDGSSGLVFLCFLFLFACSYLLFGLYCTVLCFFFVFGVADQRLEGMVTVVTCFGGSVSQTRKGMVL